MYFKCWFWGFLLTGLCFCQYSMRSQLMYLIFCLFASLSMTCETSLCLRSHHHLGESNPSKLPGIAPGLAHTNLYHGLICAQGFQTWDLNIKNVLTVHTLSPSVVCPVGKLYTLLNFLFPLCSMQKVLNLDAIVSFL